MKGYYQAHVLCPLLISSMSSTASRSDMQWHSFIYLLQGHILHVSLYHCNQGSRHWSRAVNSHDVRMLVKTAPTALQAKASLDSWTMTAVWKARERRHTFNLSLEELDMTIIRCSSASKEHVKLALYVVHFWLFHLLFICLFTDKSCIRIRRGNALPFGEHSGLGLVFTSVMRAVLTVHHPRMLFLFPMWMYLYTCIPI